MQNSVVEKEAASITGAEQSTACLKQTINISEIFVSIQGEGLYLGQPSIFIRTSGCNLRCRWNDTTCDTPYTSWKAETNMMDVTDIVRKIGELRARYPHISQIILTGGEPLLQHNLGALVSRLRWIGLSMALETNGTMAQRLDIDFVTISPKLKSSVPAGSRYQNVHDSRRYNRDAMRFWRDNYPHQFKFVVDSDEDEHEIIGLINELGEIDRERVYLMPQGITDVQLAENSRICLNLCLRNGWRLTPRLHIQLFGNVRGK